MSIFGDLETPAADKKAAELPAKPLRELSLKVHKAILDEVRGKTHLSASARTAFSDGTAGARVPVTFFLNGKLLVTIETDEFGFAHLDNDLEPKLLRCSPNELIVRVKGFASDASSEFQIRRSSLSFSRIQHRWLDEFTVRYMRLKDRAWIREGVYGYELADWVESRMFKRLLIRAHLEYEDQEFSADGLTVNVCDDRYSPSHASIGSASVVGGGKLLCRCDNCYMAKDLPSQEIHDAFVRCTCSGKEIIVWRHDDCVHHRSVKAMAWPDSWYVFRTNYTYCSDTYVICDVGKESDAINLRKASRLSYSVCLRIRGYENWLSIGGNFPHIDNQGDLPVQQRGKSST